MKILLYWPVFFLFSLLSCSHSPSANNLSKNESNLTPGMITVKIEKGKTTQAQILEIFGTPDLITHEGNMDKWGYDKISRSVAF